jgi:hypothetical protein
MTGTFQYTVLLNTAESTPNLAAPKPLWLEGIELYTYTFPLELYTHMFPLVCLSASITCLSVYKTMCVCLSFCVSHQQLEGPARKPGGIKLALL